MQGDERKWGKCENEEKGECITTEWEWGHPSNPTLWKRWVLFMMCSFCKTVFSPLKCVFLTLMVHLLFFVAPFMVHLPSRLLFDSNGLVCFLICIVCFPCALTTRRKAFPPTYRVPQYCPAKTDNIQITWVLFFILDPLHAKLKSNCPVCPEKPQFCSLHINNIVHLSMWLNSVYCMFDWLHAEFPLVVKDFQLWIQTTVLLFN